MGRTRPPRRPHDTSDDRLSGETLAHESAGCLSLSPCATIRHAEWLKRFAERALKATGWLWFDRLLDRLLSRLRDGLRLWLCATDRGSCRRGMPVAIATAVAVAVAGAIQQRRACQIPDGYAVDVNQSRKWRDTEECERQDNVNLQEQGYASHQGRVGLECGYAANPRTHCRTIFVGPCTML